MRVACALALLALASLAAPAAAQTIPGAATLTRWDVSAAGAASNVSAIAIDPTDVTNQTVWLVTQSPVRLGRLDTSNGSYQQWAVPVAAAVNAPVGLAVNPANGDVWFTTGGNGEIYVRRGDTGTFYNVTIAGIGTTAAAYQLTIGADGSAYVTIKGSQPSIFRIPRPAAGGLLAAQRWRFNNAGDDARFLTIDGAGKGWYVNRYRTHLVRWDAPGSTLTRWPLPMTAGTAAGLHVVNGPGTAGAASVCVVSEAGEQACLNPGANLFLKSPSAFPGAQQLAVNPFGEVLLTEQAGNAVSFIAQAGVALSTGVPQTPLAPLSTNGLLAAVIAFNVTVTDAGVVAPELSGVITPTLIGVPGTESPTGHVRFPFPNPLSRPVGLTPMFGSSAAGTGSAYVAEYFGTATGLTSGGAVTLVTLGGAASPDLLVQPTTLTFEGDAGGTAPQSSTIAISNQGGGGVRDWTATAMAPWLTLSTAAPCATPPANGTCGTTPGDLIVAVDQTGLAPSATPYTDIIKIDDGDGGSPEREVLVSFLVEERPTMVVAPASLSFTAVNSNPAVAPAPKTFAISSEGDGVLNWTATIDIPGVDAELEVAGHPPAITVSGVGPAQVTVRLTNVPGTEGLRQGVVRISSDNATNSTLDVAIDYLITGVGEPLFLDQEALTFTAVKGAAAPPSQTLIITNKASFAVAWGTFAPFTQPDAAVKPSWLTVTPPAGQSDAGTETPLVLSVDHAGLPPGRHDGTLTIDDGPGMAAPLTVGMTMIVKAPTIQFLAETLTYSRIHGQPAAAQTVTLANPGDAPLVFTPQLTMNNGAGWLVVSPAGESTIQPGESMDLVVSAGGAPITPGTYTGQLTVADPNSTNGSDTVNITLTVTTDLVPPVLTLPAAMTVEATATQTPVSFAATAADAIDGDVTVTCTPASGSGFALGTTQVACSANDSKGNTASGSFQVTVRDTTAPALDVPGDVLVEATSAAGATATFAATATDAVGVQAITYSPASGGAFPLGQTTITVTATDTSGNAASATFRVVVQDTTAPSIAPLASLVVEATGPAGAVATFAATATDAVSAVDLSYSHESGSMFPIGTTMVTVTARDAASNAATATFTVLVRDTTKPVLTAPADQTLEATSAAGAVAHFAATATDIVGVASLTYSQAPGSTFALGTNLVTVTAADAAGNTETAQFTITVRDTTMPTIAPPAPVVVEATGPNGAIATFAATAADAAGDPVIAYSPEPGTLFPLGTTIVTATATDAGGNSAATTFTVTVLDTTAPAIVVPADLVVEATGPGGAVASFAATATDAVGGATLTYSPSSGSLFALGSATVTVTATDAAGNQSTATFDVTVRDTTRPVFVAVPADQTVEATGPAGAAVTFAATASDLVGVVSLTYSHASGSTFPLGLTPVTATATDAAGNAATVTFSITVRDTMAPEITVPADQTLEATSPDGAAATFAATAVDAIGPVTVSYSHASGSTFAIGTTMVTATATDAGGNTATATFSITVQDTTDPVITAPGTVVVEAASAAGAVATFAATATDVAGAVTLTYAPASGTVFAVGDTTVTITATDAAGNSATATFIVRVQDTVAPTITAPANLTIEATTAAGAVASFMAAATDTVSTVTLAYSHASGSTFPLGTTAVTITATDAAGNEATATFDVTVRDTTAPLLTLPANITQEAANASGAVVTFAAAATDFVTSPVPVVCTPPSGHTFLVGTTTVSCVATDAAGNATAGTFSVTVTPAANTVDAGARVTHGPTFNGASRINGSVWVMQADAVTFNGNVTMTGDLVMPGTPQVTKHGKAFLGSTVDGAGAVSPSSHRLTLNGGVVVNRLVRRTDGITLPAVAAPPSPAGTRKVQLNKSSDSAGSFATIRDLTLNGSVGAVAVPAGTYGTFTANGRNTLVLGVAGATTPAVYHFQRLVLNGSSQLQVVGPVIVTVNEAVQANGSMGNAAHPEWLTLRIANGGLTLNGSVTVYALVDAPAGEVTLNSSSALVGRLAADRLTMNGSARLDLVVPFP